MSQSSSDPRATARNAHSMLLQRLRTDISQTDAAQLLGVNKSTINRLVNSHAEDLLRLMAVAGLRVVDRSARVIAEEDLEVLRRLARRGLEQVATMELDSDDNL